MDDIKIFADADPYRMLVAAILYRAVQDLHLPGQRIGARRFLRSVWARWMFGVLSIDYQAVRDRLEL